MTIRKIALAFALWSPLAWAQDDAGLREAEQWGREAYLLDRQAGVALDKAAGMRAFKRDQRVSGWVSERTSDGTAFTFVGQDAGQPVGLYRVTVGPDGKAGGLDRLDGEPLSAALAAQFEARRLMEAQPRLDCSNTREVLLLPRPEGGWHAFLLPRAAFDDVFLLGGSYQADLSADGKTIAGFGPMASECVVVQNRARSGSLLFAEDRLPQPNALHVYLSDLAGKPMYVTTTVNGRTWLIQGGHIHSVPGIPAAAG